MKVLAQYVIKKPNCYLFAPWDTFKKADYNLNKYKIPIAQSNSGVFSGTASCTGTYDIAADSAWCVGGHWPTD